MYKDVQDRTCCAFFVSHDRLQLCEFLPIKNSPSWMWITLEFSRNLDSNQLNWWQPSTVYSSPVFRWWLTGRGNFLFTLVRHSSIKSWPVSQAVSRPFCRNGKEHWARSVNLIGPQVRLYYGPSAGKCLQHIAAGNVIRSCDSEKVLMMIMTPFKEQQPR